MARLRRILLALPVLLAGCGGGISLGIGIGDDDWWDEPPQVSLVASAEAGAPGQTIRLSAAASDDRGVDQVAFYRVEAGGSWTPLGSDAQPPYALDTPLPGTLGTARFVARAFDGVGQRRDSAVVEVAVR